ncbi:MAG: hypothetical protein R3239_04835, partial [Thermodesulfobacteriota bacterium]|nr:hypothetical protein [Thermodesulfobacteriota bacterium]
GRDFLDPDRSLIYRWPGLRSLAEAHRRLLRATTARFVGIRQEEHALFLDSGMRVVALYRRFRKNRLSRIYWNARGVLELPGGTIERTGTEVGDEIEFRT